MKQTMQIEVHCCDSCGKQENYVTTCANCGTEHCYECQKTEGKAYPHGVYVGGSGDGYYCKKCDAELTKAGTDKKHKAYLGIASLRLEAAAWSADFERRRKDAEAKMERHNAKSQATDAALSRRVRLIDGFGGTG